MLLIYYQCIYYYTPEINDNERTSSFIDHLIYQTRSLNKQQIVDIITA